MNTLLCVPPGRLAGNQNWCYHFNHCWEMKNARIKLNERFIFIKCERRCYLESCRNSFGCSAFWHWMLWKEQLQSPWVVYSVTKYGHKCHMHVSPTSANFFLYSCRSETRYSARNLMQIHITPDHHRVGKKASKNKIAILVCLQA